MKIIFLDFDGVLNSLEWWKSPERASMIGHELHGNSLRNIDPACVERLQRIVDATGARIVVSSAWRWSGKRYRNGGVTHLRRYLAVRGLRNSQRIVIGCTPCLPHAIRGIEIRAWLDRRPDIERFAVIDDERHDMEHWPELVKTNWECGGLLDCHVVAVVKMLNMEPAGE
jgi:hypothetical protein